MACSCSNSQEVLEENSNIETSVSSENESLVKLYELLVFTIKGITNYSSQVRKIKMPCKGFNNFLLGSLLLSIPNEKTTPITLINQIKKGIEFRGHIREKLLSMDVILNPKYEGTLLTEWEWESEEESLKLAENLRNMGTAVKDVRAERELVIYGIKGLSGYVEHAMSLGIDDTEVFGFIEKALLATEDDLVGLSELNALAVETWKHSLKLLASMNKVRF